MDPANRPRYSTANAATFPPSHRRATSARNHAASSRVYGTVDREYERLTPLVDQWVQKPTTMPWGNRSIMFRDPDGNLVNLFTPVTEDAINKFRR
ncbi:VOC family protein [Jatrophihabitans lederbergiae]|uniref:VOC family protein n=1 Tax=Jatrophihabitans lederbergiae TaxID=3075547 RepID=UPI0037BE285E